MQINLSDKEASLITEILEQHQRELLREIARSRHHEFKRVLREKEDCLATLLSKLNIAKVEELVYSGGE